jgi:carboxymethylenebutenolidase
MERRKASDFPQEVLDLYDGVVHGTMNRREFLDQAAKYAVGGFTAAAMLEALQPNFSWAQQVARDDKRIQTQSLDFDSPKGSGKMKGYLAKPAKPGKLPGIVVIHENRGLNPYIEDVARRLAVEGYVAFAPDSLAPVGGYPGDEDKGRELFAKQDAGKRLEDLAAGADYLKTRPEFNGKLGAIGFCFGGLVVNQLAVRFPDLAAGVPYYGRQVSAEDAAKIRAALLLHFAEHDDGVNKTWPAYEQALKANKVRYQAHVYPGTNHGFHNDTTPRYDEQSAKLSWSRTVAFFKEHLGKA